MNSLPSLAERKNREREDDSSACQREPAEAQHEIDERLIGPDQESG